MTQIQDQLMVGYQILTSKLLSRKLHADMSNLKIFTCSTGRELILGHCLESSSDCMHCARDSSSPKLYSLENNMDSGPVPSQLQVMIEL